MTTGAAASATLEGVMTFRSRVSPPRWWRSLALLVTVAAACGGSGSSSNGNASSGKVEACVLLPGITSSVRYELFDRLYLTANFKAAGVKSLILNALGDQNTQKSQGDQCLTNGRK